jgi:2-hydroxy-4-carboxymuconate semialdehyde hemiacetal dehydrogenase
MSIGICVVGLGAFGHKHLEGLANIADAKVVAVVGGRQPPTQETATKFGVKHASTDLAEALQLPGVDAVILCTPTQLHASQAIQCLEAGKHVQVEIPMADTFADAARLVRVQQHTGLIAMAGHTRRFNPSHQWIHKKIVAGELTLQHLVVRTCFLRRTNINALGQPRSWVDHLLWHHACHTVDLFAYQAGAPVEYCNGMQGPIHPELGIALDMSVQLKTDSGVLCTLALSYNNDGPIGTTFRYICDKGTFLARYDDLFDGEEHPIDVSKVDVSMNGIELQDREFVAAIRAGREPNASVAQCLPAMKVLHDLEQSFSRYS